MEAVGLVGALLGIIDKTARCISSLAEIQQRFKSANLTLELLTGQLFTVKAALSQLCDLIKESLVEEQHYQLTLDLDVGVYCCNLLTRLLEEQIVKLQYIDADELTFKSKVSLLLGSKGTDECLTRLDRQINALNLLITAFKFRTPKEQQILLEQKQSRKTFNQIKDDSSSLIVLCDSESSVTKRTKTSTATSKLSLNFVFDAALLQSKAYKSALRSLMRKAHRSGEPSDSSNSRQQTRKSYNSAPMHMIHADLDRSPGQFTGLPAEWKRLWAERGIAQSDRQLFGAYIERKEEFDAFSEHSMNLRKALDLPLRFNYANSANLHSSMRQQ